MKRLYAMIIGHEGLNIDTIKISSLSLLVDNRIHVYINLNFVKVDVKGLINETLVIFRAEINHE